MLPDRVVDVHDRAGEHFVAPEARGLELMVQRAQALEVGEDGPAAEDRLTPVERDDMINLAVRGSDQAVRVSAGAITQPNCGGE